MKKKAKEAILKYWKKIEKSNLPSIKVWLEKENKHLKRIIKKDSVVLDIGCGLGRNIKAIANIAKKII